MADYAALLSFSSSIQDLLASFLVPTTQLQNLHDEIESLLKFMDRYNCEEDKLEIRVWRDKTKVFVEGTREAVWRVEDKLDDHVSAHCLSLIQKTTASASDLRSRPLEFTIDLQNEIDSFLQVVKKINNQYGEFPMEKSMLEDMFDEKDFYWDESDDDEESVEYEEEELGCKSDDEGEGEESDDDEESVEYKVELGCKSDDDESVEYEEEELQLTSNYQMVGLVDQFIQLRRCFLLTRDKPVIAIVGMAGIGKTAMAKQLYNDPLISKHFEGFVFVSLGRSPQWKQIVIDILSQIQKDLDIVDMQSKSLQKLSKNLLYCLSQKRYLIVFDDLWNKFDFGFILTTCRMEKTIVLVTTRIERLFHISEFNCITEMIKLRLLNEEESWSLFCEKVFGKDSWCPYKLVEVGKKIVENCEGLPLAIIAIANLLTRGEKTLEYWKKVSEDPNPLSIGTNDQDPALNTLYSSYEELEQHLQACFLYMGIFPRKQEIPISKLLRLWEAERLVPRSHKTYRGYVVEILKRLSSESVIFVTSSTLPDGIKTCRLHSVFWHLCVSEARKEYVVQVVDKFSRNSFQQILNGHRRICVHNNTLFGIKDANNFMLSMSNARSLLCTGPHHHYPVPMEFKMRLLRVLDVATIRFYVFPSEVVQLVQIRYLALTYNGIIHASISQLWNLEFLIVEQHTRIISLEAPLYLPVEIWNMEKLKHLQVTGALLPHPPNDAILPRLLSISKINAQCLTNAVLSSIPNLEKLSIQIDLSAHDPFCFSDHLSNANTLYSLKCVVVNPKPRSQAIDPPAPSKIFPKSLCKLTLSGFGYPWKYFGKFDEFSDLKVLKLRNYAFQGPEWEIYNLHMQLEVLHLEDLDLINWRVTTQFCFPLLRKLTVRHCYRLREIPLEFEQLPFLKLIELVEVQPSVVASAKKVVQQIKDDGVEIQLNMNCSCKDGN